MCVVSNLHTNSGSILVPVLINVFVERSLWESLNIRLDDSLKRLRVVFVSKRLFIHLEHVRLQLQPPRDLVVHNDLAYFQHLLIYLRIVLEELLGCLEIANTFVYVKAVEEL